MTSDHDRFASSGQARLNSSATAGVRATSAPGKRTLTQGLRTQGRAGAPASPIRQFVASSPDMPAVDPFGGVLSPSPKDATAEDSKKPGGVEVPYRSQMERLFNTSFAGVDAHLGEAAALSSLGARAAAKGESVAFASASPSLPLVAHELTHVVQQRNSGVVSEPRAATSAIRAMRRRWRPMPSRVALPAWELTVRPPRCPQNRQRDFTSTAMRAPPRRRSQSSAVVMACQSPSRESPSDLSPRRSSRGI